MLYLSEENKIKLIKRFKSFAWRTGGMVAVMGLEFMAVNLELFDLPMVLTVILGLAVGELTKYYNTPK